MTIKPQNPIITNSLITTMTGGGFRTSFLAALSIFRRSMLDRRSRQAYFAELVKLGLTPSNSYNLLTLRFTMNFWQKSAKRPSRRVFKQLLGVVE